MINKFQSVFVLQVTLIVENTDNLNSTAEEYIQNEGEKDNDKNNETENNINETNEKEKEKEDTKDKEEENTDVNVDYHIIEIDNKPAVINGIKKIIDNLLVNEKNESNALPALIEEETVLNINS